MSGQTRSKMAGNEIVKGFVGSYNHQQKRALTQRFTYPPFANSKVRDPSDCEGLGTSSSTVFFESSLKIHYWCKISRQSHQSALSCGTLVVLVPAKQ